MLLITDRVDSEEDVENVTDSAPITGVKSDVYMFTADVG